MPAHYICAAFARKEKSYEFCIVSGHRWCIEYPDDSCGGSEWKNRDRRVQSEAAEKALKQFGDAAIILTSDWKLMREDGDDFSYLVSMLGKFGLSLSGKTTDVWVGRGEGIQSYLTEHPEIDEYVILDDNTFDFSNYPKLWERLLLTNGIENAEYASKTPAIEAMLFLEAIS